MQYLHLKLFSDTYVITNFKFYKTKIKNESRLPKLLFQRVYKKRKANIFMSLRVSLVCKLTDYIVTFVKPFANV